MTKKNIMLSILLAIFILINMPDVNAHHLTPESCPESFAQRCSQELHGHDCGMCLESIKADSDEIIDRIRKERDELRYLIDKLNQASRQTSLSQIFLSGHYFTIFTAILAIAALISGIVSTTVLKGVQHLIKRQVRSEVEDQAAAMFKRSSYIVVARAHSQQAYALWDHCHGEFVKFLKGENFDSSLLRDAKLARDIAMHGLKEMSRMESSPSTDFYEFRLLAGLKNHWLYNKNAEIMIRRSMGEDIKEDELNELLDEAYKCIQFVNDERYKDIWYGLANTIYFVFLKNGDAIQQKEAAGKLLIIMDGQAFKSGMQNPPKSFVDLAIDFYFPKKGETEERYDLHGFGRFPKSLR